MGAMAIFRWLVTGLERAMPGTGLVADIERQQRRIDDLVAARQAVEQASAAKSAFLGRISGELRTPLNALLSYSETLLDDAEREGRSVEAAELRKISAAGLHALGMVNDILDISRIESGRTLQHLKAADNAAPGVPAVLHRGPSPDERAFLDEIDAETSLPSAAPAAPIQQSEAADKRERVLVVDDDRSALEMSAHLLLEEGYRPLCTHMPQSALQMARSARPTAIFLESAMAGFDGWDVLAALKADAAMAAIPVFLMADPSERGRALAAGADGVVSRPLDAPRVKAAMTGLRARGNRAVERHFIQG